ncbi:site-specific DNA-methyltransferase, partial [Candidatus Poribacteria bacterium]|nr:site-specific DNA-methyltransferase [Candidatus Poribacteria bacterium]
MFRIIVSSTNPGDIVLDPFAGSGTTLVVAAQLNRKSIGIELDAHNVALIQNRLTERRESDNVSRFFKDYACTPNLEAIWAEHKMNEKFGASDAAAE